MSTASVLSPQRVSRTMPNKWTAHARHAVSGVSAVTTTVAVIAAGVAVAVTVTIGVTIAVP